MKSLPVLVLLTAAAVHADPQLSSWFTEDSGQYARIYQSTAAETTGTVSKTWSRGTGVQASPIYAGVSQIAYSTSWVYVRSTGLAGHIVGPWYLDAAKTANFPNFPSNTAKIYRIPRVLATPAASSHTVGAAGFSVTVQENAASTQTMWQCTDLDFWEPVSGAVRTDAGGNVTFTAPPPLPGKCFYSILSETP